MDEERAGPLREALLRFVRRKFANIADIGLASEDIVDEAFASLLGRPGGAVERDFAYLSRVCVHVACGVYRDMRAESLSRAEVESIEELASGEAGLDPAAPLLRAEAIAAVAASLEALREIERAIVVQRYYGESSFAEIARSSGIKLNTVLSHHRRALEKLRPRLAMYFREGAETESPRHAGLKEGYAKFF